MKVSEAIEIMKSAPRDDKPSKLNKIFTRSQVAKLMDDCLEEYKSDITLNDLIAKRVLQVSQDRKRV